jgi:hypothetical protein
MTGFVVKPIDEIEAIHHGIVKLAGAELGVESFGIQVFDLPPRVADYPEHDHSWDRPGADPGDRLHPRQTI